MKDAGDAGEEPSLVPDGPRRLGPDPEGAQDPDALAVPAADRAGAGECLIHALHAALPWAPAHSLWGQACHRPPS